MAAYIARVTIREARGSHVGQRSSFDINGLTVELPASIRIDGVDRISPPAEHELETVITAPVDAPTTRAALGELAAWLMTWNQCAP
jgi:hypothetical protein